jgi:hypothetical protein
MKSIVSALAVSFALFAVSAHADQARIEDLKSQIRGIAIENLERRDNLAETRARLEPLVKELSSFHRPENAAADLPLLEGAWKELFSDDVEPEPPGFGTDRDGVYQVITSEGYFYNFGNLIGFGPLRVLGVLRGEYKPVNDFLNIEFTKVSVRLNGLRENEDLDQLVADIESGAVSTIVPPGDSRAPNGPVGAQGNIRNIYIDSDFRVATGSNFADGIQDLFVLDKVTKSISYK